MHLVFRRSFTFLMRTSSSFPHLPSSIFLVGVKPLAVLIVFWPAYETLRGWQEAVRERNPLS
jgi:hypothetical protein